MSSAAPVTSKHALLGLAVFLAACFAASFLGGVLTGPNLDWYATLAKPSFTPPSSVFGIVWTVLYAMIAVSGWLVWRSEADESDKRIALIWFGIQLALNVLWSFAFFFMQSPLSGLVVILVLLTSIVLTIVFFSRVSRVAALLLVPYLLWVCFAAGLNFALWFLNSGLVPQTPS